MLFGDGKGNFTPGPPLPNNPDRSYSAPLADMNKDGTLDIVLSNDRPDPKLVLLNDGKGHFTIGGTFGEPSWPTRNVAVADLNGDGYPDIAVANRPGPSYVCMNDGKVHFQCKPLGPDSSSTILAADIDGDGFTDLIVACRDDCQSAIYFNDGKGNFPRKQTFGAPRSSIRAVAVADFDGDGHLDIATCDEANHELVIYFNSGAGKLSAPLQIESGRTCPIRWLPPTSTATANQKSSWATSTLQEPFTITMAPAESTAKCHSATTKALFTAWRFRLRRRRLSDIVAARSDAPSLILFSRPAK